VTLRAQELRAGANLILKQRLAEVSGMLAEYHYRVDRSRVPIPPRCRHKFQDGITLYYVSEEDLIAGCAAHFMAAENGKPLFQCSLGSRGRITIPQILRELTGVKDTVVILFDGDDYLELWGERHWELEKARACEEAADLCRAKAVHKTR